MEYAIIEDTGGRYVISNKGFLFSVLNGVFTAVKNTLTRQGYYSVGYVTTSGERKIKIVHRLVAKYFLENKENKPIVNHLDGIKTNNQVSNLEWVTYSENTKHAWDIGLFKRKHLKSKFDERIPPEMENVSRCKGMDYYDTWVHYTLLFSLIDSGMKISEISKLSGVDISMVSKIKSGKRSQDARKIYDIYKHTDYCNSL